MTKGAGAILISIVCLLVNDWSTHSKEWYSAIATWTTNQRSLTTLACHQLLRSIICQFNLSFAAQVMRAISIELRVNCKKCEIPMCKTTLRMSRSSQCTPVGNFALCLSMQDWCCQCQWFHLFSIQACSMPGWRWERFEPNANCDSKSVTARVFKNKLLQYFN